MRAVGHAGRGASQDIYTTFARLGRPRLLVLGDLILDRYTWGNAERVSQEAPVITLLAQHEEERPGGAANVCQMIRGLEGEVVCAGIVGDDAAGVALRSLLTERGIDASMVLCDAARPTTSKHRFIGRAANRHPHQILRVDREVRKPLEGDLEAALLGRVVAELPRVDGVLISDYGKGVCTPPLLREVITRGRQLGMPVLVDPFRTSDYERYRYATAITPNRAEAELAGGATLDSPDAALLLGQTLCRKYEVDMAFLTLDRDGMALTTAQGGTLFPTRPRDVYDITGAGDMVLAMVGLCLAAGIAPEDAARLGNVAGGLEVQHVGVAVLSRHEIAADIVSGHGQRGKLVSLAEMCAISDKIRARGESIVFTNGCFDLLHVGHVTYLAEAATFGDHLIVAINSDASVRRLKGPTRPLIRERDRAAVLEALECVDFVLIFEEDHPRELLRALRPDVLVKGGNYTPNEVVGREIVDEYGGRVVVTSAVEGISTTRIVELAGQHHRGACEADQRAERAA